MKVLLIDNYDSFSYNLVHILRELEVDFEVHRNDKITVKEVEKFDRLIFSPGPGIPEEAGIMKELIETYFDTKPMLGVCLGHQAIAEVAGARLQNLTEVHHGVSSEMKATADDPMFHQVAKQFTAGRYHSWVIEKDSLPAEMECIATDDSGEIMAIRHRSLPLRGVQFHPESIMSESGTQIIKNFLAL